MRTSSFVLLFVSVIALTSAQMAPTWEEHKAPQPIPTTPAPAPCIPVPVPNVPAPAPVELKPLTVAIPSAFVPEFERFAKHLLYWSYANINQFDVKKIERGILRLVAAFSYLHLLPFDSFVHIKNLSLEKIILILETIKNELQKFIGLHLKANTQNGVVPVEHQDLALAIWNIGLTVDVLKKKIQEIRNDGIGQDNVFKEQLSNDGRRLKSLKN